MANKLSTKKLKKTIVASIAAIGMAFASFTGLTLSHNKTYASAASSSLIENYNFKTTSGSSTPPSPSKWTKISGSSSSDIVTGVFSSYKANTTTDEDYLDKFKLLENPGTPEGDKPKDEDADTNGIYRSLLINSPKYDGRAGFESSSFKLESESYYVVTVTVMTMTRQTNTADSSYSSSWDSRASMYVINNDSDADIEVVSKFEMVDTNNSFGEYIMYIETNDFSASNVTLQLYLGGRELYQKATGAVLFNSAQVLKLDGAQYQTLTKDGENQRTTITKLSEDTNYAPFANNSFETDFQDEWTIEENSISSTITCVNGNTFSSSADAKKTNNANPRTNNSSTENKYILFMHLADEGEIKIKSQPIDIKQHAYYKLSVWAYTNDSNGTPSIILHDDKEVKDDVSLSVSANSSSSSITNNWVKYTFYIYGNAYSDSTVSLILSLTATESGYVFFDDITMQQISYDNFNNNKSNSNCTSMMLTADNSQYNIANFEFDSTSNDTNQVKYPLAPKSWTANIDSDYSVGGVINTQKAHFNANKNDFATPSGGVIPQNPGYVDGSNDDISNNILYIANNSSVAQASYSTDDSVTASASTTYKISFYAYSTNKGGIGVKLYNSNYYIFNQNNINTLNAWKLVEIYFTTGTNGEDIYIQLSQNGQGYAYFDAIKFEESDEDEYASSQAIKYFVDLTTLNWENTLVDGDGQAEINLVDINQSSQTATAKIVDIVSAPYANVTAPNGGNRKALVIDANDIPTYFNVITTNSFSLSADNYYSIEAQLRTVDINDGGAYLAITGDEFEQSFTSIDTQVGVKNEWTTYTFYIKAQKDISLNVVVGLGDSEQLSTGIVLVDHIAFTQLDDISDDAAFNALIANNIENTAQLVTIEADPEESDEDTDQSTNDDTSLSGDFNWAIVPSLITALAILIALIGTLVRKVNWRKNVKVKTTYDRRKTLEKDMDRRERIALRQQIIAELNDQILAIDREIEEYTRIFEEQEKVTQERIAEQQREFVERKQEITAEKEQLLHERNEKIAKDKNAYTAKAEADFNAYIKKLELQEQKQDRIIASKEAALKELRSKRDAKLAQYLEKQAKLKEEIARVDAEIEEIAREEAQIWEEYKQAKAEAKRQKAEYKAQLKQEKEERKSSKKAKIETIKIVDVKQDDEKSDNNDNN